MNEFLNKVLWGNTIMSYLLAFLSIIALWFLLKISTKWIVVLLKRVSKSTSTRLDDIVVESVEKFAVPWLYLFLNYNIISLLSLSSKVENVIDAAFIVISGYYLVRLFNFSFHKMIVYYLEKRNEPEHRIKQVDGMLIVVKAIAWAAGIIMLADNLGYDVTTIIAGLGVGGIAIALAAQSILGDLFSYIVIFFDKPFEIGDFIIMQNYSGIVEKIGIKTTHVRSLDGQQLIIPNAEMAKAVIQNYKRLERRRIVFTIGVVYDTASGKLSDIPRIIKGIISKQAHVDIDRVHLKSFGDFSINFEIVYYLNSADYVLYMDTQQQICVGIFEAFAENKIEFAFPTKTLFVANQNEKQNNNGLKFAGKNN